MEVTFTKAAHQRYTITVEREHGPALLPRFGPGYDDRMPHDLAHYVVEEYFEIELGVWGQLAAGGGGMFTPAPEDNTLGYQRRVRRIGTVGRDDMARSERLVAQTVAAWRRGKDRDEVGRLDEVAARWHALQTGGSITFAWPRHLTFDAAGSHRGRRTSRRTPAPARHEAH